MFERSAAWSASRRTCSAYLSAVLHGRPLTAASPKPLTASEQRLFRQLRGVLRESRSRAWGSDGLRLASHFAKDMQRIFERCVAWSPPDGGEPTESESARMGRVVRAR